MKKLSVVLLLFAVAFGPAAGAQTGSPIAVCNLISESIVRKFEISESAVSYNDLVGRKVVVGETRIATWVTYSSTFAFENEKATIIFSNFITPSIGTIYVEGHQPQAVSCLLLSAGFAP